MLAGREIERGRIDALLEDAAGGRSGVLLLSGEPGIGKSALLGYARERANGMWVLSTRGVESEADLAFAGLHELLGPVLERIGRIPPPQAAALSAALALGPPTRGDRFAVAAGTLSLLGAVASERPVLVLVDDVHWLDSASSEALRFALRRLGREPIAALLAARGGDPSALDGADLPELVVAGLEPEAARTLLPDLAPDVVTRLIEATGGNPLALQEIPALLSNEQATGAAPLPVPLPAGAGITRAFRQRIAGLGRSAGRSLVVAAASQRDDLDTVLGALSVLGIEAVALETAEQAGLIATADGRLEWRHPLLRAAAYHAASPSERRSAHCALAEVLEDASTGERAWHLAAAASGPSELVAVELERAALDARGRQAPVVAARTFERAAELSPDDEARARRLLEAAHDFRIVGLLGRARSLLDDAARTTRDPLLGADVEVLRGLIEMWSGDPDKALALLVGETNRTELLDRERAAMILIEAVTAAQMSGNVANTVALARRASELAEGVGEPHLGRAGDLLLSALILAGEAPPPQVLRDRLRARAAASSAEDAKHLVVHVGHMLVWIAEHDIARELLERELGAARASGAFGVAPYLEACLCELDFRVGRFAAASSAGASAVRLAEETEQLNLLSFCLVSLARVEAATGRTEDCRMHALRALEIAEELGVGSIRVYGLSVLGLLELGLGRPLEALERLEQLAVVVDDCRLREPGVVHWRSDLVEAQALAGQNEAALASLAVLEKEAALTGREWAGGVAERCRGMLAEVSFESHFEEAMRLLAAFPFERARTQLRLGERLRRARRPIDARGPLRSAVAAFERLGATPWAARARAELAATGARRRSDAVPHAPLELTPQELRIARLVADGATNREVAAQLFLSPKTIGYHLGKIYDKLGIRSRAQLARLSVAEDDLRLGDAGDVLPVGVVQVGLDDDGGASEVERP